MTPVDEEIQRRGNIADIVNAYESAMRKLDHGYRVLAEAEAELKSAFSITAKHDTDFAVLPGKWNHSNDNISPEAIKRAKEVIKRKAWRVLYDSLEIDRVASIKRRDEINEMIEKGTLPEITVKSIYEIFDALRQNVNEFARESVLEVYAWLRPAGDGYEMTRYKTNQKNATFEVGQKVIKTNMLEFSCGHARVSHWNEKYLIALDKVFHMLDGSSILDGSYRSPLVDAINTAESRLVETDYFRCRIYFNGNLHIEFTRPDLVKRFNAVAGGANLKPRN